MKNTNSEHIQASPDFFGRESELARIRDALVDAEAGRGRVVLIDGEAGIGKTRLAEEAATIADSGGFVVLRGRCFEEDGTPPLWPWIEVLRGGAEAIGWPATAELLANHTHWFSSYIPELPAGDQEGPQEDGTLLIADSATPLAFDLAYSISGLIDQIARKRPVLITFDDIQWADELSLELLKLVVRGCDSLSSVFVVTHRNTSVPAENVDVFLAHLHRCSAFTRLSLRGLDSIAAKRCLEAVAHRRIDEGAADRILDISNGNPFFVRQIAAEISRTPASEKVDVAFINNLGVPDGISLAVNKGVSLLDADCRRMLEYASLIGSEFPLEYLLGLPEHPDAEPVMRFVDQISATGIIYPLPDQKDRYRFDHDLVKMAVSESIPSGRKKTMHANLAARLEMVWGDQNERRAAEILHHLQKADPLASESKVARYGLMAGRHLLSTGAFSAAAACLESGLIACAADDHDTKAQLHIAYGQAILRGDQSYFGAHDHFNLAIDEYEAIGDHDAIARMAPITDTFMFVQLCFDDIPLVIDRIRAYAQPGTKEYLYTQAQKGLYAMFIDIHDWPSRKMVARVLEEAGRRGYKELEREIQHLLAHAFQAWGYYRAALPHFRNARDLCSKAAPGYLDFYVHYRIQTIYCLSNLGQHDDAETELNALSRTPGLDVRQDLEARVLLTRAGTSVGVLSDLSEQQQMYSSAEALLQAIDGDTRAARLALAANAFHRGSVEEMVKIVDPIAEEILSGGWLFNFPAFVTRYMLLTADLRWKEAMVRLSRNLLEWPTASSRGAIAHIWRSGLAAASVFDDDTAAARSFYDSLNPEYIDQGYLVVGLLAGRLGEHGRAVSLLKEAAKEPGAWAVWSLLRLGQLLIENGNSAGGNDALDVLTEASAKARRMGMKSAEDEAEAALEAVRSPTSLRRNRAGALTLRESEILRLLASGKTDKEIAAELYLSASTVSNHVRKIFRKIGVGNRTEAALYAARNGMLPAGTQ